MSDKAEAIKVRTQSGPQHRFVSCPANEIFFGGARGGGKSYGVILDWMAHFVKYGSKARGILFRRSMPELEDMQEKAEKILTPFGFEYHSQGKTWLHSNGGRLKMRYLDRDSDAEKYQGHQYNWMGFDEAGNWFSPSPINKLRSALRDASGVKVRMILTGNPGGAGHNWLKARYVDPSPPGKIMKEYDEETKTFWTRVFIPSLVTDNKILLKHDPGYIGRIKQSGPAWLVKAWLEGLWDIVAGGIIDDVFHRDVHVLRPFRIPKSWYVDRSFDWGSAKPFAVCWWAESDGTDAVMADGKRRCFPRGTIFHIAEYYGWNGTPNEGLHMPNRQIAQEIKKREDVIKESMLTGQGIHPGCADTMIFNNDNGNSIAEEMSVAGIRWEHADKSPGSRVNGLNKLRELLSASHDKPMEKPGMFIFDTCSNWLRTVPTIERDDKNPEDADTTGEEHCLHGDTMIMTDQGIFAIKDLVGKEGKVLTEGGLYTNFAECRLTRKKAEVIRLFLSDGREIVCTPDHKFMTNKRMWEQAKDLKSVELYEVEADNKKESAQWNQKKSMKQHKNSTESDIGCANTILCTMVNDCIERFGSSTMGKLQKAITSIIKTMTEQIISWRTWKYLKYQNINRCMGKCPTTQIGSKQCMMEPKNGMEAQKADNGIKNISSNIHGISLAKRSQWHAHTVKKSFSVLEESQNFAQTIANQQAEKNRESIWLKWFVKYAEQKNRSASTKRQKPVPENAGHYSDAVKVVKIEPAGKADVYCLNAETTHSFAIAGGIIVHNCYDSTRYRILTKRQTARRLVMTGI